MIGAALIAIAAQSAVQATNLPHNFTPLDQAARAIDAGRLDQARLMIAQQIAAGAKGPKLERLLADLAYASGNYAEAVARYPVSYTHLTLPTICSV